MIQPFLEMTLYLMAAGWLAKQKIIFSNTVLVLLQHQVDKAAGLSDLAHIHIIHLWGPQKLAREAALSIFITQYYFC